MGKIEKKQFREPRTYYANIALGILWFLVVLVLTIDSFFNYQMMYDLLANRELYGDAKSRFAIIFYSFLLKNFGQKGLIIFFICCLFLSIYYIWTEASAFLRYKRKTRLYQAGLIDSVYDIYDDYKSWDWLRRIFSKKNKRNKKKYPSKRYMKKQIKQGYGK
jgi:hypothetical protein